MFVHPEIKYSSSYDNCNNSLSYKMVNCSMALYNFECRGENNLTLSTHTSAKQIKFECDTCGKSYGTKQGLLMHIWGPAPFQCETCGDHFTTKHTLSDHVTAVHMKIRPFSCTECDASFSYRPYLKVHMAATHKKNAIYWQCDVCGRNAAKRGNLAKHISTVHLKLRPFKCDLCSAFFSRHEARSQHKKLVHALNSHDCDLCSRRFFGKPELARHFFHVHMQIPLVSKRKRPGEFGCDVCGAKILSDKCKLATHIASFHTQRRSYECGICGAKYTSRSTMQSHRENIHKAKRFVCDQCGSITKSKGHLAIHYRIIHCKVHRRIQ